MYKCDEKQDVCITAQYTGDMIRVDRLSGFFTEYHWVWNDGEPVCLDDISRAIQERQSEESTPFGDNSKYPCMECKPTSWHIRRVLYFIKHPDEIRDIEIDNLCDGYYICPIPVIVDGNHRLLAAIWLNIRGEMDVVHCRYGGRDDLREYLTGASDTLPLE